MRSLTMRKWRRILLGVVCLPALALGGVVLSETSFADQSVVSPAVQTDSEATTVPTPSVASTIAEHFAIFRRPAEKAMPSGVAVGVASSARFGRNPELARPIETASGTGWVIPGDGFVCLAVPDPVDGYGTACMPTDVAITQGVWLRLHDGHPNGRAIDTILVPDGEVVRDRGADGKVYLPNGDGVVSQDVWRGSDLSVASSR